MSAIDASPVGKFRLKFRVGIGTVMFLMFFTFTVAPLLGILIYGYRQNEASALRSLEHQVSRNMNEAVVASAEMIETVGRTIAIVAEAGAHNPWHFKTERGNELLWRALTAGDHIDAVYVSQEDGYHRVVTRIDDDRHRSDRRIPANATWHASYVDEFSKGDKRARHRQFFSIWGGESSGEYATPTDLDIRKLPHFIGAKRDRRLSIITIIVAAKIRRLIRYLVSEFDSIGQFTLTDGQHVSSFIDEVRILDQSKEKMKTSLRSFGRYVPTDLVRKLIVSGEEAELGGERRKMTIFFSDIADFTSILGQMDPEAIAQYMAADFAEASKLFAALARDWPDQTAAAIMARRARKLHRTPPEGDWTGVYVHTKK